MLDRIWCSQPEKLAHRDYKLDKQFFFVRGKVHILSHSGDFHNSYSVLQVTTISL